MLVCAGGEEEGDNIQYAMMKTSGMGGLLGGNGGRGRRQHTNHFATHTYTNTHGLPKWIWATDIKCERAETMPEVRKRRRRNKQESKQEERRKVATILGEEQQREQFKSI